MTKEKGTTKEKRKRNADRRVSPTSAPLSLYPPPLAGEGREGRGAHLAGVLAYRRSTTALAAASERRSSAPDTRFLGLGRSAQSQMFERSGSKDRALLGGCYPLLPVPVQRASRRPVIGPAGRIFPERPRARVTSRRPRAPFSLRQPASPASVLYVRSPLESISDALAVNLRDGQVSLRCRIGQQANRIYGESGLAPW
jgi:hypothetical protein